MEQTTKRGLSVKKGGAGRAGRRRARAGGGQAPGHAGEGRAIGRPMVLAPGVHVYARSRQDSFIDGLRDFIGEVAASLARALPLEDAVAEAAGHHPNAAQAFDLRPGHLAERFGLKARFLFPRADPINTLAFGSWATQQRLSLPLEGQRMLPALAGLLHLCGSGAFTREEIRARVAPEVAELVDALEGAGMLAEAPEAPAPEIPDTPGVVRLQHAGLLFRTARAGVLVDPHFNSIFEPRDLRRSIPRAAFEGKVDAILISHSHEDHFNLASLATFHRDTPIVVPRVPRASVLSPDMARRLKALGFRDVRTPDWYSRPLRFGDLEIEVLPFYGEQPLLREPARSPLLRNWGNTYLLRTPAFRAWVLIDSGADATGRMAEVGERLRKRFGGVDLVLSNLRRFAVGSEEASPFYILGAGQYWLALTPDQMRRFNGIKDLITLGPEGAAEVCRAANARYFLPYAHWWSEPGTVSPDEPFLVEQLQRHLGRRGTKILSWSVGDAFVAGPRGRLERRPCFR